MTLVALVLGLSLFGLIMVYDASVAVALSRHGERFYFVVDQARNLALGLVSLFIVSRIDYQIIKKVCHSYIWHWIACLNCRAHSWLRRRAGWSH